MARYNVLRFRKLKNLRAVGASIDHNKRLRGNSQNDIGEAEVVSITTPGMIYAGQNYADALNERLHGKKPRKNATYGIEAVISFSPGAIDNSRISDWVYLVLAFLKEQFGEKNIYSANLHLSESTPHIHAILFPFSSDERMNANVLKGKKKLADLQTALAEKTKVLGLERGVSKLLTNAEHEDFRRYKKQLAEKENRLEYYEDFIFNNSDVLDEYMAFLEENSEKKKKEEKEEEYEF